MSYYGDSLRETANYFDRYVEDELELIKLAGFNLSTLIDKLKAGYTIEAPKEKDWAPHLLSCACSDDWAQGMTEVYMLNVDYGWDDLTDYEKRLVYESQKYLLNKKNKRR